MFPAIVPAAAATPLPDAAAADAALPEEGTPFDEALAASLEGAPPAPMEGLPVRRFVDPLAIAEWMLLGTPGTRADAASIAPEMPAGTDSASADDEPAPEDAGSAWWDIPMDALLVAPAPLQDAPLHVPLPPSSGPIEITIAVTPVIESPASGDLPLTNERAGSRQENLAAEPPVDDFRAATRAAGSRTGPETTAPRSDASPVPMLEPAGVQPQDQQQVTRLADAATPASVGRDDRFRLEPETIATPTRAGDRAEPETIATPTRTGDRAERAPQAVPVAAARAPEIAVTAAAAPAVTPAEAVAPLADAAASPGPREARGNTGPQPAGVHAVRAFAARDASLNNGDAQSFDSDARRSPAATRLAAALSSAAAAPGDSASSSAPVFAIPSSAPAPAVTAAAPVMASAPPPVAVPDAENLTNLIETMRVTARGGGWEATLRLKPEHLGEVTIALRVDGNAVSATVNADAAGVRQWLIGQEDAVRSGMAEHGLQLHKFEVERDGQRSAPQEQEPQEQPRRRTPRRQARDDERFEIVV